MNAKMKNFVVGLLAVVVLLIASTVLDSDGSDGGSSSAGDVSSVAEGQESGGSQQAANTDDTNTDDTNTDDTNTEEADTDSGASESGDSQGAGAETGSGDVQASTRFSDLPTISVVELPDEGLDTLDLIGSGGPYPYSQDDTTFQNREGILPDESSGHYREYTVDTPGLDHRGPRRIVAGADGELYYTDDHYESFSEIVFGQ